MEGKLAVPLFLNAPVRLLPAWDVFQFAANGADSFHQIALKSEELLSASSAKDNPVAICHLKLATCFT
jgi:hypothetical protein